MDWDIARIVLALARHQTASAAARALDVDQTTVSRRLAAAEELLGAPLFERVDRRLRLTAIGDIVVNHAEQMAHHAAAIANAVQDQDLLLSGVVRIAVLPSFGVGWLIPRLGDLRQKYPGLRPTVLSSELNAGLEYRDADLGLRLNRPADGNFVTRLVCKIGYAVYRAQGSLADDWIGLEDTYGGVPQMTWMREQMGQREPIFRVSGSLELLSAVGRGLGKAILPCYLANDDETLERLSGPIPVVYRELWLVIPEQAKFVPRIRALADWLIATISKDRPHLEGVLD